MKTVKKTYESIINLVNTIAANAGDGSTKGQKKLIKIHEKLKSYITDYNDLVQDLRLEYASVDDKNNLILDDKNGYVFSKENTRLFNAALKELLKKEVDFTVIDVVNPAGLDAYSFLESWISGVNFIETDDEEL